MHKSQEENIGIDQVLPVSQDANPIDEEEWAQTMMQSMGFDEVVTTKALEIADFSFSRALLVLLHGNDDDKTTVMGTSAFPQTYIAYDYGLGFG